MFGREFIEALIVFMAGGVLYIHKLDFTEKALHPEHRPQSLLYLLRHSIHTIPSGFPETHIS